MAITGACHVESAMGSGARMLSHLASGWENRAISIAGGGAGSRPFIVACQAVMEPRGRGIRRREWSSVVTVTAACQGVMELRGIRRRKWSRAATVTAACRGVMELRRICRRKWSRIVVVAASRL